MSVTARSVCGAPPLRGQVGSPSEVGERPDEGGVQWNIYNGIGVPGSVTWGDPVSEEEYNAPVGRR